MDVLKTGAIVSPIHEEEPDTAWGHALQSETYRKVEQRVIRQLLQALMYEDLVRYDCVADSSTDSARVFVITGKSPDGDAVEYRCVGQVTQSFGLIKLRDEPVVRTDRHTPASPAWLHQVLADIVSQVPHAEKLASFVEELEQTLLKDVQAQSLPRPQRLCEQQRQYDELEANITEAHAYHPSYKSRIGFSLEDNRLYGPEFKHTHRLSWLAVHKRRGRMNQSARIDYRTFIEQELGHEDFRRFASALERQHKAVDDYWLLPVHPWQRDTHIACLFHPELANGELVWLGQSRDTYRAQQSIRTLANAGDPAKAYVKLSLSITNTSTSRILAAHTVMNAAIITDWLQGLLEHDAYAGKLDFAILGEVLGVTCDYESMEASRKAKAYGTLGAIWRESLHRYLRPGESAVPFNGLCHVERYGRPLIDPWIQQHGLRRWTEQLLHVSVTPIIHMLFAHGIGMESHAQNIVLVHDEGWPVRVVLKDFHDGVRFSPAHLTSPERCPRLAPVPESHARVNPSSFILTDDPNAVRDFTCDSFFFICLAEVAIFLARHYGLPEHELWSATAQLIHTYQARNPEHDARFRLFDVFAPTFAVEELTRRRLLGDGEPRFRQVPNPLHQFRAGPC
jgi:siderophore synthetase component